MNETERLRHNAGEQGLTVEQAREVDRLLAMPLSQWPPRAAELARELGRHGICGEVFVAAAVQYLKEPR